MSNRALIIAVSLLVTIAISSAVLLVVNQVTGIYRTVYETDTLIQSNFDEFDEYDNTVKTKLDLLNVSKKYKDREDVYVTNKSKNDISSANISAVKSERLNVQNQINKLNSELLDNENTDITADIDINSSEAAVKYRSYVLKFDEIVVIVFNEIE